MSTSRFAILLGSALLLFALNSVISGAPIRTVALSGQPAPGTPSGVTYSYFNDPPALNAAGQTAFKAHLTDNGTDLGNGVWSEGAGALNLIASSGTPAPGTSSGVSFGGFDPPVLNAAGQVAFSAELIGNGVDVINYQGIWSEGSVTLDLVARNGSHSPGTPSGVTFGGIINGLMLMNDAGHTACHYFVTGSSVGISNDIGIWSDSSGNLDLVAREGDQAPDTAAGVQFDSLRPPVLNNAGQTAFVASTNGSSDYDGIWLGSTGSLHLVAREGNQAPGTPSGINYHFFSDTIALNAAGQTAFIAFLIGSGIDFTNDEGVWVGDSGTVDLVARAADHAPGTSSGVKFASFSNQVLNSTGRTAFRAAVSGSGVNNTNRLGIWSEGSGTLELVARQGSHAPGTPSGVNFVNFVTPPVLNGAGQTAFAASLVIGNGVDPTNNVGIWATDLEGELHLIIRAGDLLEVAPSDFRTISSFSFYGGTGNEDGRRSGFNDMGQLAFYAFFTDGSSGIFVSNLVAVPEPATFTLACVASLGLFGLSRRR